MFVKVSAPILRKWDLSLENAISVGVKGVTTERAEPQTKSGL